MYQLVGWEAGSMHCLAPSLREARLPTVVHFTPQLDHVRSINSTDDFAYDVPTHTTWAGIAFD